MITGEAYNTLPEGFEGKQKRRTKFDSTEEKLGYDADGLIALAKKRIKLRCLNCPKLLKKSTQHQLS